MILTQKMIDKLSVWKAKDENNGFVACYVPLEFTEKYLPNNIDELYNPITQIKTLAEMIGMEEFFISITYKSWTTEVRSDEENLELLIALEKEKYYLEKEQYYKDKISETRQEKLKILG